MPDVERALGLEEWFASYGYIAGETDLSENRVEAAVEDLEKQGWILVHRRRRKSNVYTLAWPQEDCMTPVDSVERYAAPTSKGMLCTERAGYGTITPGSGPCWSHCGIQKEKGSDAQPVSIPEPVEPQPLRSNPVDNSIRRAMQLLAEQGWTVTVQGRGTFVTERENWPAK
jgi:hypothetical protein